MTIGSERRSTGSSMIGAMTVSATAVKPAAVPPNTRVCNSTFSMPEHFCRSETDWMKRTM
jgi:hypothetical protein